MFTLTIDTANAAFGDDLAAACAEVSEILGNVQGQLGRGIWAGHLMDSNGNTVGEFSLTPEAAHAA